MAFIGFTKPGMAPTIGRAEHEEQHIFPKPYKDKRAGRKKGFPTREDTEGLLNQSAREASYFSGKWSKSTG
jgi:hypothetical protein